MSRQKWNNDPLALAFIDYFEGKSNAFVYSKTNLGEFEKLYVSYFFRDMDEMPFLEKTALDYCTGSILDVGAGAGCHSILLQDWELEVTALEISNGSCEIMRKRGIENVIQSDIFKYSGEQYDTLLFLMNGIGVCGTLAGMYRLLIHLKTLLRPNGQIIFDSSDIEDAYLNVNNSHLDLKGEYYGEVEFTLEYREIVSKSFRWLYIDRGNMQRIAEDCGFKFELLEEGRENDYLARLQLLMV